MSFLKSLVSPFWAITNSLVRKTRSRKSLKLPVPVISVGNIVSGGVGKTEVCISIANYCISKGLNTVIALRGYRSEWEKKGGFAKSYESGQEFKFPDEALVALKKAPGVCVIVGSNRYQTIMKYWKQIEPQVVILDDGFQHFKMNRDLDILVHDFSVKWPLLRDFPSVFETVPIRISLSKVPPFWNSISWVQANYQMGSVYNDRYLLFCGIGNPERVLNKCSENKIDVLDYRFYKDHKNYKVTDIQELLDWKKNSEEKYGTKLKLLTTLKDEVKCSAFREIIPDFDPTVLNIELKYQNNESELWRAIDECIHRSHH